VARSLVEVKGADQLYRLARELAKQSDGRELKKDLLRKIRTAALPLRAEVRANLAANLPKRGGLNRDEARARIGLRNRTTGKSAGVRLQVARKGRDLQRLDRGIVRHPLFGDRRHWYSQHVSPRLISDPVVAARPRIRRAVIAAMDDIAKQITDAPHRG
jgi:hypothetical protein